MPKKKKRAKAKKSSAWFFGQGSAAKTAGLSTQERFLIILTMIVIFMIGLVLTDMMSKAMAQVMYQTVTPYDRQIAIGSEYNQDLTINTGVETSYFESSSTSDFIDAELFIPTANLLSYQLFNAHPIDGVVASSTGPYAEELVGMDSYGCTNKVKSDTLYGNRIYIRCQATAASPIVPEVGDIALVRYLYVPGEPIFNPRAVCGDGVLNVGEICDDGNNVSGDGCTPDCKLEYCGDGVLNVGEICDDGVALNGTPGHCNLTCSGFVSTPGSINSRRGPDANITR